MKINLAIFISSIKENDVVELMMKTFEFNLRPAKGDILEDPGFHNGYEFLKVTISYTSNECFISLQSHLNA